jgi:hypothetical protein
MLFPEITRKCFSLLNCIEIDDTATKKLLRFSPDIECWTSYHHFYILTLALPGFIIWGVLYPIGIFLTMYRNQSAIKSIIRNSIPEGDPKKIDTDSQEITNSVRGLSTGKRGSKIIKNASLKDGQNEIDISIILKFIYKGYKEDYYYWELVIFAKKIILIFIGSFTDFFPNESKATVLLALICIFLLLQVRIQPYENSYLNQIELLSLFVTFLTANFGLLLYSEDFKKAGVVLLAIMIMINVLFFCFWIYVFIFFKRKSMREKKKIQKTD